MGNKLVIVFTNLQWFLEHSLRRIQSSYRWWQQTPEGIIQKSEQLEDMKYKNHHLWKVPKDDQ